MSDTEKLFRRLDDLLERLEQSFHAPLNQEFIDKIKIIPNDRKEKWIDLCQPSWDAHISIIRGEKPPKGLEHLWKKYDGQKVEFEILETDKGPQAKDVNVVE